MSIYQPPWASELLARNRKVGRTIWSTSEIYQRQTSTFTFEFGSGQNGRKRTEEQGVNDPSSTKVSTTRALRTGNSVESSECESSYYEESLVPVPREMKETLWTLSKSSGEDSIVEYGPGIVSKLRSKYQSLSSRQSFRPSLRRSASLEHSLELVESRTSLTSPNPVSRNSSSSPLVGIPGIEETEDSVFETEMTLTVRPTFGKSVNNNSSSDMTRLYKRGRSTESERSFQQMQNRMRRARSVDALHHAEYTPQEEEILEKFKTVVLPKEEVVIIEMSKPRLNIESLGVNVATGKNRELKLGSSTYQYTISPLISPENELPPHDIVRDTAKIFENNNGTAWKKVGHALRVCKSPSLSSTGSACNSPSPTSPIPTVVTPEKKIQVVPAQPQRQTSCSQNESTLRTMNNLQQNNKLVTKSGFGIGLANNTQNSPVGKQVGIIRPTVNGVIPKNLRSSSLPKPPLPPREANPTQPNRAFQFITPRKPMLSPKPLLPTKPKDIIEHARVTQSGKNVIVNTNGTNEKPAAEPSALLKTSHFPPRTTSEMKEEDLASKNVVAASDSQALRQAEINNPSSEELNLPEVPMKATLAFPVTLKPVGTSVLQKASESKPAQESDLNQLSSTDKPSLPESQNQISQQQYNDVASGSPSSSLTNMNGKGRASASKSSLLSKENAREGDALKKQNKSTSPTPVVEKKDENKTLPVSHLRSHQKQKLQQANGGGTMVFNFTSRNKVPDYIEDDGLRVGVNGTTTVIEDDDAVDGSDRIDPKLIEFIGANVIINGKSSIQKKPKSQKLNISFNEEGTTTFEYPSESSVLNDDDTGSWSTSGSNNNLSIGNTSAPGATNLSRAGGGLSSFTPSKVAPTSYQLGFYRDNTTDSNSNRKSPPKEVNMAGRESSNGDVIEDYLKPDTGSTTWSSEIGAADILF